MIRLSARFLLGTALVLGSATLLSSEASAQATRTFVSGVGDDANPCSRTAPCRTWAGAISKTAAGGEMDCLDPGGFGAVTVTKSMTIICDWSDGGILVAGQNGIVINDGGSATPGTAHVVVSGLNIEGLGNSTTSPGIRGIYFVSGASLTVRNTTIRGFRDPTNGAGIGFLPTTPAKLTVTNTSITSSGAAGAGGGIVIAPSGTGYADVVIENSTIVNNRNIGVNIAPTATGGTSKVTIVNSTISNNENGVAVVAANPVKAQVLLKNNTVSNNPGYGLLTDGTGAKTWLTGNSFANNTADGLKLGASGVVQSYGDNTVYGSTNSVTPTATPKI
jgi:hypothetical protein